MLQLIKSRRYQDIFVYFRYCIPDTVLLGLIFQYKRGLCTAEEFMCSILQTVQPENHSNVFLGGYDD